MHVFARLPVFTPIVLCAALVGAPVRADDAATLEEIVVTASLRGQTVSEVPSSTTVLAASTLEAAGLQHFGDVLGLVPNLNWSGGTSRPRYFQLRGIGELEQYQGAPNPSVGFLIDEIDLSGVGMPATLFDTEQVEVLRGPQGTRYGANALAGLIKVKTRDARREPGVEAEVSAGGRATRSAGVVAGGPLRDGASAWRLVGHRHESDGFQRNAFLGRDDTDGREETTLRGKLGFELPAGWRADLAALYVDLDNGFDAFSPDNSRRTLADRPGRDAQRTTGASVVIEGPLGGHALRSASAFAVSDVRYSFDGDWGNDDWWGPYAPYDYFSAHDRERTTLSQDLRLQGTARALEWAAGLYVLRLEEVSRQRDWFEQELLSDPLAAEFTATSLAGYGEAEWSLGNAVSLTAGLRLERRDARYDDSSGARFSPADTMLGGQVSLERALGGRTLVYLTAARGFKAGGFNIGAAVPEARRQFDPEYLWNLEAGLRFADERTRLQGDVSVFHMWRGQQQVATSFQLDPGDPLSYVFYTDNAARGRNYGLEGSLHWHPAGSLVLGATLGLLRSEYLGYRYGDRDLDGRDQAHAPRWQYSLSAQWGGSRGLMARADLSGSDAYYFDASHDERSEPHALLNLKAGYAGERWAVHAWARNLTDERYAVRGFFFGLEPPEYAPELYVQRGDGRLYGVTAEWRWR